MQYDQYNEGKTQILIKWNINNNKFITNPQVKQITGILHIACISNKLAQELIKMHIISCKMTKEINSAVNSGIS